MEPIRHDWTLDELSTLYHTPLLELIHQASQTLEAYHERNEVQVCSLISIKTGGCPEDCKYCAQSSRYQTPVEAKPMLEASEVLAQAEAAVKNGATRVCLGAAWRSVRNSKQFEEVLTMISSIRDMGIEVCGTLGMLEESQAQKLKQAGLFAYNHNLDTSEEFYPSIITTRTYQDRLDTLDVAEKAGLSVCCGGIIGMGESVEDRLKLIRTLATRNPHPESVPINRLTTIPGTPLEGASPTSIWEMVRLIATTRIAMPKAMVRLSAGRIEMSLEQQMLCFLAGANSIFSGEKLLTVANTPIDKDEIMFQLFGLKKRPAYAEKSCV